MKIALCLLPRVAIAPAVFFCMLFTVLEALAEPLPAGSLSAGTDRQCPDRAGGGDRLVSYETESYRIFICLNDGIHYHGEDKEDLKTAVTLPASVEEGRGYVARNDGFAYIVDGRALTVYEGDRTVLQEDVQRMAVPPASDR